MRPKLKSYWFYKSDKTVLAMKACMVKTVSILSRNQQVMSLTRGKTTAKNLNKPEIEKLLKKQICLL